MKMRLKNGRWYAALKHKGKMRGYSLDASKSEKWKAIINLGRILEQLERGDEPNALKQKFETLLPRYSEFLLSKSENERVRSNDIVRVHLLPYFVGKSVEEITSKAVEEYVRFREEKDNAAKETLKREIRAVKDIVQRVNPEFKLPVLKFKNRGKTPSKALTPEEVLRVQTFIPNHSRKFGKIYETIYQILAFTGLDVKEVTNLNWNQIDLEKGWITTSRFKTGNKVLVPICGRLDQLLRGIKIRSLDGRLFPPITSNAFSTAIKRSFLDAGLHGFNAKSLRHFTASLLLNSGVSKDLIGLVLGHSKGSRCTDVYLHAYDSTLKNAFSKMDSGFENAGDGESKKVAQAILTEAFSKMGAGFENGRVTK